MPKKTLLLLLGITLLAAWLPGADKAEPCPGRTARPSAAWVQDAVIYEVFTRSFSDAGTFREVERALPRLKELGVTVVWLMPIHRIGVLNRKGHFGSPYSVQDYYSIDPQHGSAEEFRSMVKKAHELGLKVIIDMVANHTAWDSVMLERHPEFFTSQEGKVVPPVPDWTDVADLNYDNPQLRTYMIEMLKYWIREFDLDGYRCDVANMIPLDFWEQARLEMEKLKPELFMLAEGDWPQSHLRAFDSTYSWRFYESLIDVLVRGQHAEHLQKALEAEAGMFPKGSLLMRFNDNHDKIRAVNLFGDDAALAAAGIASTVPGLPMLYNGQEIGDPVPSNDPALFEKYDILWNNHPPRMKRFQAFYANLLKLRRQSPALRSGQLAFLETDRPEAVFAFRRVAAGQSLTVVANTTNRPVSVKLKLPGTAELQSIFPDAGETLKPGAGLELAPYAFLIFE